MGVEHAFLYRYDPFSKSFRYINSNNNIDNKYFIQENILFPLKFRGFAHNRQLFLMHYTEILALVLFHFVACHLCSNFSQQDLIFAANYPANEIILFQLNSHIISNRLNPKL